MLRNEIECCMIYRLYSRISPVAGNGIHRKANISTNSVQKITIQNCASWGPCFIHSPT